MQWRWDRIPREHPRGPQVVTQTLGRNRVAGSKYPRIRIYQRQKIRFSIPDRQAQGRNFPPRARTLRFRAADRVERYKTANRRVQCAALVYASRKTRRTQATARPTRIRQVAADMWAQHPIGKYSRSSRYLPTDSRAERLSQKQFPIRIRALEIAVFALGILSR